VRILLTGASGFLGSHIAEQLDQQGADVRALVRPTSDTRFLEGLDHVTLLSGALSDKASLLAAMEGVDGIIHAAGLVKAREPVDFHRTNAQGTANLLGAAKQNASAIQRFVLVSSLAVMGPSEDGRPVPSGAAPNPVTHYGGSKLAAEQAAQAEAHSLPITIIRPPMIYGPRDREILPFFKSVQLGVLPLTGSPDSLLSAIFAVDCAAACIKALDANVPSGSTFFVEDGRLETLGALIAHIENALDRRAWLRVPVPRFLLHGAALGSELYGRVMGRAVMLTRDKLNELLAPHWVCDSSEAQAALSWKPLISFAEGTRITGAWYRRQGWL
jgi:nucleoside-diphosphate-sugar epimerase